MSARHPRRALVLCTLAMGMVLAGCGSSTSAAPLASPSGQSLGPSVAASGSEATSAVARCRVDQGPWQSCVSPFAAFDLAPGPHVIDVEPSHGGVRLLRRPAASTGDRVAVVAFANSNAGPTRASASFTVEGAAPAGSVALSGPSAGSKVRGLVPVKALVRGGSSRVALVDFYVGGRIVATSASAPWNALIDSTRISPGARSLRAVAISLDRRRRASPPVGVTVLSSRGVTTDAADARDLQARVDALPVDGGTLRLPAGRFEISGLRLGSGVRLIGAGAGRTVLVAPQGVYEAALRVTGHDVLVSDLSIDARGRGAVPDDSAAISVANATDVVLRRLQFTHLRGWGVHVEGHHQRVSLQQSTLDGSGRARAGLVEWAEDATSGDISVVRCVIRNMQSFGVLFQSYLGGHTWPDRRALAYGNDISGINNPTRHDGTVEIGIWLTGYGGAALDNVVRNAGWDGIETVVNAMRPTIAGNIVRGGRTGIYIENVTRDALIEQNDVADVIVAGINLEPPHSGPASGRLTIRSNRIVGAGEFGIGIGPGTFGNRITSNQVFDSGSTAILLEGASGNVVEGNDLRDRRKPPRQRTCVQQSTSRGSSTANSVSGNDCSGSLDGASSDLSRYSARRGLAP